MTRLLAATALAFAMLAPTAFAADAQILLVHGYGPSAEGKDCNGGTWRNALRYYQDAGGRERSSITTIGYYPGDRGRCDVMIGDGNASNQRPIQDIAKDLAIVAPAGRHGAAAIAFGPRRLVAEHVGLVGCGQPASVAGRR